MRQIKNPPHWSISESATSEEGVSAKPISRRAGKRLTTGNHHKARKEQRDSWHASYENVAIFSRPDNTGGFETRDCRKVRLRTEGRGKGEGWGVSHSLSPSEGHLTVLAMAEFNKGVQIRCTSRRELGGQFDRRGGKENRTAKTHSGRGAPRLRLASFNECCQDC